MTIKPVARVQRVVPPFKLVEAGLQEMFHEKADRFLFYDAFFTMKNLSIVVRYTIMNRLFIAFLPLDLFKISDSQEKTQYEKKIISPSLDSHVNNKSVNFYKKRVVKNFVN